MKKFINKNWFEKTFLTGGFLALSLFNIQASMAADSLQVKSDHIKKSEKEIIYDGNVTAVQGTLVLNGDKAIAKNKNKDKKEPQIYIVLTGNPASFQQIVNEDQQISGSAKILQYDSKANQIHLKDNASITKDGKEIRSASIIYNLEKKDFKSEPNK
jgi:lipopolysaccharide export system protein LptA